LKDRYGNTLVEGDYVVGQSGSIYRVDGINTERPGDRISSFSLTTNRTGSVLQSRVRKIDKKKVMETLLSGRNYISDKE
jgi:hypothetical protein